ncbi:Hypothetical predicted protein [Marmota monax]|uniref:G-protein coupled receptors family 1 profile domain-containing protein n=1 Tax=Marmota monax TaxID=9995 RepID=A0A5E4D0X4_MARMO|nr:Hypothetical predicted protein [Marmota monax]
MPATSGSAAGDTPAGVYMYYVALKGESQSHGRRKRELPGSIILLGFSGTKLERPLCTEMLVSRILKLTGNGPTISLSLLETRLQTPTYLLLDKLSVLDLCVTCTIVPQMLANLWGTRRRLPLGAASRSPPLPLDKLQECALLMKMASDLYMAICQPLRYPLILRPWVCGQLAAAAWSNSLANSVLQATLSLQLPFCGHHTLDHFFCELPALIKLACVIPEQTTWS